MMLTSRFTGNVVVRGLASVIEADEAELHRIRASRPSRLLLGVDLVGFVGGFGSFFGQKGGLGSQECQAEQGMSQQGGHRVHFRAFETASSHWLKA